MTGAFVPNELGQEIFETRYAYPGEKSWAERSKVIAKTAASVEKDEDKERWRKRFYDSIAPGDLVPGGRIIFGSGRSAGRHNLLNCYVIIPEDTVESIGKTVQDVYKISCAGGGIGFNFSKIRPKGDNIQNIANSAPGAVSVIKMINEIGNHVKAGKNRRTALMGIMDVTHPDLFEFLHVKLDQGELTNFNISVAITDRFIEAVENDEEWYFWFNNKKYFTYYVTGINSDNDLNIDTTVVALNEQDAIERANAFYKKSFTDVYETSVRKDIRAREIWDVIWKNSVESGDPGIYNIDLANRMTNVSYFEDLYATNPCGEISLPSYGNCCLGNVNLSNMVDSSGEFDWNRFDRTVKTGIVFLDNILQTNHFPTIECKEIGLKSRRIGLGVMGLHYMLIKMGIRYGSDECLEFLEQLFTRMRNVAYMQSVYQARDKTPFPAFDRKRFLNEEFAKRLPARVRMEIKKHGIRNAVMLTIPPTGTISMLMGVSSGIEPIFAPMYERTYREDSVWKTQVVVDPLFKEYMEDTEIQPDGNYKWSLDDFVGAYDVTPEDHIRVQAVIQPYIDSCISKTINLPETAEWREISEAAIDYVRDLKGLTVYKAGSKGNEPLKALPLTQENIDQFISSTEYVELQTASSEACSLAGGDCGA